VGIIRFSDIEERKRNETDAKAGDELSKEQKKGGYLLSPASLRRTDRG